MLHTTQTAPDVPAAPLGWSLQRALPELALFCAFLAVWIVQHPAYGLVHDSQLYSFQALARLHPELYSQDIYLRYGSQDNYTLFSPLFGLTIGWLGIENAAALITLLAHAAFFAAATCLVRTLIPGSLAWLGLALLCAVPGYYGNAGIFLVAEDFATPRLFAEALVTFGLFFFVKRRFWLAGALGLASMLLHPLMGAAGIAVALCMSATPARVRAKALGAGAIAGVAVLALLALSGRALRLDDLWLHLTRSSLEYLWVSQWTLASWVQTIVYMTTLAVGVLALERSDARSLSRAALIAGAGGIVLSFVTVDLLHMTLALQLQLWRWSWVSVLVASLLAPFIIYRLWSRGTAGRCAAMLLVAAWLWRSEEYGIGIAALALLAALGMKQGSALLTANVSRLLFGGAVAVLALACAYHFFTQQMLGPALGDWTMVPQFMRDIRAVAKTGILPFAVFVLFWLALQRLKPLATQLAVTLAAAVIFTTFVPSAVQEWGVRWYARHFDAFAQWRELIPPRTEVLWFESPLGVWLLLQRPSYLSGAQESSALFSPRAADALKHRSDQIQSYLAGHYAAAWVEQSSEPEEEAAEKSAAPVRLTDLCAAAPDLRFLVTERDVQAQPLATLPASVAPQYRKLRLYRCESPHG